MKKEEKNYEHPSFGMLRFSRVHGRSGYLFGSEIQADNYIELTLSEGHLRRDLSNDWFTDGDTKFRVKMSPSQFAELITTMNYSPGVPVTIIEEGGERVEQISGIESKKTYTHNQFRQRMAEFMVEINEKWKEAEKILNKSQLSKKDREELKWFYQRMNQEVKSNIPFFMRCFQEVMDKVVVDAKVEIDSAIQHKIIQAGIKALGLEDKNKLNP